MGKHAMKGAAWGFESRCHGPEVESAEATFVVDFTASRRHYDRVPTVLNDKASSFFSSVLTPRSQQSTNRFRGWPA